MKLDVAFVVPGMPFNGNTMLEASLGGSETAATCLAREIAKRGHNVKVFCNCDIPGEYDGVQYLLAQDWPSYGTKVPFDVAIGQRTPEIFNAVLSSQLNLLWCHDLAMGRAAGSFRSSMWNIDKVVVLSDFMRQQYKEVYDLPDRILWQTRNGIDLNLFPKPSKKRNIKQLVYGARPERGLDLMLEKIFPRLFAADPELRLVCTTYANAPSQNLMGFYQYCNQLSARFPEGVITSPVPLSKRDYYKLLATSGVYTYPTPSTRGENFAEVSCISVMECQGAGLPVVTSDVGALRETLAPGAGRLIRGKPGSDGYVDQFVEAVLEYVNNPALHAEAVKTGRAHARELSWSDVADDWLEMIDAERRRHATPRRLVNHFIRRSDIDALEAIIEAHPEQDLSDVRAYIDTDYGFLKSDEEFAEHYRVHGTDTTQRLYQLTHEQREQAFNTTSEERFRLIEYLLNERPEAEHILDYGCGHGWSTLYYHNKLGREWLGIDVDPGAIEWASQCAQQHAKQPDKVAFALGDRSVLPVYEEQFDAAIASEVLEHVREPYETLEAVERCVKKGGLVIVTVPYGPVEFGTANWFSFRNHVREWTPHDLREIFGNKHGMTIRYVSQLNNEVLQDLQGFHVITYTADHEPVGRVDMKRKLATTRPRLTLSTTIIAGGHLAHEHLHACLNALPLICDEVIVADCGMTPETRRIVESYPPIQIVPGVDPRQHGFDVARNEVLKHATGDWVLWLDTDETLVNPGGLMKYMRDTMFDGYCIRQHHFATDMPYPPDTPCRLFRRVNHDGVKPRFYGSIHEHPERGMNEGPGTVVLLADVHIAHPGYYHENVRRSRFVRNKPLLELDKRRNPDRVLQNHFVCRDNTIDAGLLLQRAQGMMTPEVRKLCEESIKLYRDHFLDGTEFNDINTVDYYSQANALLGQGFNVVFEIVIERDGFQYSTGRKQYRFASESDLARELAKVAKKAKPLTSKWW